MVNAGRIDELLLEWESAWRAGRPVEPEKLCPDWPEGQAELRRRAELLRKFDTVFSPGHRTLEDTEDAVPAPEIPGFIIRDRLGRGGMGLVYRAWQPELDREVAIKVMKGGLGDSPQLSRRFAQEARLLGRLRHDNIVPIYEAKFHHGRPYIVMKLMTGGSLADRLRLSPLAPAEAARMLERVARGVQAAHELGIVHRDLKPGNILLERKSETRNWKSENEGNGLSDFRFEISDFIPKVADFGLAKLAEQPANETQSGMPLGTPSYMAPEQVRGERGLIGPACDVYALGALLYECLTGRPPFQTSERLGILLQVLDQAPIPPSRLQPKVPRDLETICLKCLDKQTQKRYPSAAELAHDLHRFLAGEPIRARPVRAWEKTWKRVRRRPALAGLAGITLAALVVLGVAIVANYSQNWEHSRTMKELSEQKLHEEEQLLVKRQGDYCTAMQSAWSLLQAERRMQFASVLQEQVPAAGVPDLRSFEWHYLSRFLHCPERCVINFFGKKNIYGIALSPDGRQLAVSVPGEVRFCEIHLFNTETWQEIHTFYDSGEHLAFSPDGKILASAGTPGAPSQPEKLRFWDLTSMKLLADLSGHPPGPIWCLAFNRDGKTLVTGGAGLPRKVTCELHLWDVETKMLKKAVLLYPDFRDTVIWVGFLYESGKEYVVVRSEHGRLTLYPLPDGVGRGQDRGSLPGPWATAMSPNQRILALGLDRGPLCIFNFDASFNFTYPPTKQESSTSCLSYSRDGRNLVAGFENGRVAVFDTTFWRPRPSVQAHDYVKSLQFMPDSHHFVSAGNNDGTVKLWDIRDMGYWSPLEGHAPKEAWAVAFSPDGKTLATGGDDELMKLWDAESGRLVRQLVGHPSLVSCVAFSPDGRTLAAGDFDGGVRLWEPQSGKTRLECLGHEKRLIRALAFAPNGKRLASACRDKTIRLWDPETATETLLFKGHREDVRGVAFAPDSQTIASCDSTGIIKVWDAETGKEHYCLTNPEEAFCIAFAPNGDKLAVSFKSGVVRMWDSKSGTPLYELAGHKGCIKSLAFTPDGRTLATGSDDKSIRLWNVATGLELFPLEGHNDWVTSVAFSPDGRTLASASHDGAVFLWKAGNDLPSSR
jgi:WD40 repeat protein/serine/threonine protein kinase